MQKEFMKKKETGKLIIVSNRLPVKDKELFRSDTRKGGFTMVKPPSSLIPDVASPGIEPGFTV